GRSIQMLTLGVGDDRIMFWSQMHGDEPSATPALLDIVDYLLSNSDQAAIRSILENYTLLVIPMLNPDGAEAWERRNAQGIDINRDALQLVTPEGRLLKRIRDEYQPMLGLNLHDQNRMTTVGDTGRLATCSVLSVSGDAENTLTRGRLRTKRACTAIVEALTRFIPGGIARYDEEWSPRAFGDNITAWGTPVVLIETGGFPAGFEVSDLTRLNFVAILTVLLGLADDDLATYDPEVYEDMPENQTDSWSDFVVRGGFVMQPGIMEAFRSDLAFNILRSGRQAVENSDQALTPSQIILLGDASGHGAGTSVNADGKVLLAAFEVGVKGLSEKHWMDQGNLSRLAQMGVGTIYWEATEADYVAALAHAATYAMRGLPRIEVLINASKLPTIMLSGPPPIARSNSINASMEALGLGGLPESRVLDSLWVEPADGKPGSARLCKDQPASFVMVTSTDEGQIDFTDGKLISVWIDGCQLV
ncbi:MAG: M14 family zinc carboxypeptidase, partial [Xanthomonadales bacterium]|nr:M14 family zinc carboxypeptidase [Xanthomonadales bacterium]